MARGADTRSGFRPDGHDADHFLLTTVVGSYPTPEWLARVRDLADESGSGFDDDHLREAHDDAARLLVDEHERAGLDVVADGETRRAEMVEHFARRISGFEFNGPVKVWGHNYFEKPSVVSEVAYDEPWVVDEFAFAADVATRPVKVPITGPYTLARWSFDEVYGDEAALATDLADLLNQEIQRLVDAGARYVQIDEPALSTTPEDHAVVGACLERIVDGLPADVRVCLHVCYGDYAGLYPAINDFPIDEFDVALCDGDDDQLDVFREPPIEPDFGAGVVDAHDPAVESVAEIRRNIERALTVVPPEKLTVSPDCGLKLLPREAAFRKLQNLVTAARETERALDAGDLDVPASEA